MGPFLLAFFEVLVVVFLFCFFAGAWDRSFLGIF